MLKALFRRGGDTAVEIPDPLWDEALAASPFVARLGAADRGRLRALAAQLLATKSMSAAGGLALDGAIQTRIALQACLPILNLALSWYRGWQEIVIYPGEFLVPRRLADEDGVVHEYVEPLAGESWQRGPLVLSWDDVQLPGRAAEAARRGGRAYNVVIHEFAHKIDQLSGEADGMPPFDRRLHAGLDRAGWRTDLDQAFEQLNAELDLVEQEMPRTVDPESPAADAYFDHLPIDPYAANDLGEFFAVSSEAFFVTPARLRDAFAPWYARLAAFYRQDPLG
jgi:Mlc titration factor MtfA (ptsG expression regulator)